MSDILVPLSPIVCFCNNVSEERVRACTRMGAGTLDELYDMCTAGVGPCGGSCRSNLRHVMANEHGSAPLGESAPTWVPPLEVTRAISLFNRRYYWETHEILEELWLAESGETKIFYQGIIQAAAAFYHVLNSNPKGVIKLAEDSATKLSRFLPRYQSIPLEPLVERLRDFADQAREILGRSRPGFDYDRLPQIKILA